jgi:hypothetical protein
MIDYEHPMHYRTCSVETAHILTTIGVPSQDLEHECIDAIEHQDQLNRFPYGMFHMGNAIKYLWRAGKKSDLIEDLKKAEWYIERYRLIWIDRHWMRRFFFGHGGKPIARLVTAVDQIEDLIKKIESNREPVSDVFVKVDPLEDLSKDDLNVDSVNLTVWD